MHIRVHVGRAGRSSGICGAHGENYAGDEAKRIARRVLGVAEGAGPEEIKRAWRRACMKYHPDRNPGDEEAERRLIVVNCAYRVLTRGDQCSDLLDHEAAQPATPSNPKVYNLDTAWGLFVWWRERFFD